MMSTSTVDAEAEAFLAWAQAVLKQSSKSADKPLEKVEDLSDGVALFDILADIDPELFRNPHSGDTKDSWVLTIGTLKRLYKLMMQYYTQTLRCSPTPLPQPDLNLIARSSDLEELCKLCLLVIGIAVQSDKNELHISAIQTLPQVHQQALMLSIERIITSIKQAQEEELAASGDTSLDSSTSTRAENKSAAELSTELSDLRVEKETIEKAYIQLIETHRELQNQVQDLHLEKQDLSTDYESYKKQVEESRNEQADVVMRQEIDKLKHDLRRSEDTLAELENDNERLLRSNEEMQRKMEDLEKKAEEGIKLKDQMDEYKHAAEKLQKAENAIEKYKKKLEEGADVRRQLKLLEEQNAELVDKNASLEDEYNRVSAFKPLMDSYKNQIANLESKTSNLQRDLSMSKYEQEQILSRLKASEDQRVREKEEMELYQERIKELELGLDTSSTKRPEKLVSRASNGSSNGIDSLIAANESMEEGDDEVDTSGELEDALSGTTMTDLKIKVRKLTRELEGAKANKADQSRIIVLENLLEDAQRMKARYETDYLREHKEKIVLQKQLETIRSGKSDLGDGTEAAYALRLRLNEVVEELDAAKRELTDLQVLNEQITKELTIAKSDLTLVNKDQVDILHSLRASMDAEKDELEAAMKKLKSELALANEQNKMYMAQVNSLLMEKVDLQAEGIGQRDEALKRERALGELKTKLKGKSLPKEVEEMVSSLQQEAMTTTRELKMLQDKFSKAKQFIKQQDKMLKDKERSLLAVSSSSAIGSHSSGSSMMSEEVEKELKLAREEVRNLRREQRLMMSAFQDLGRRYLIELESGRNPSAGHGASSIVRSGPRSSASGGGGRSLLSGNNAESISWLSNQRRAVNPTLQLASRR